MLNMTVLIFNNIWPNSYPCHRFRLGCAELQAANSLVLMLFAFYFGRSLTTVATRCMDSIRDSIGFVLATRQSNITQIGGLDILF